MISRKHWSPGSDVSVESVDRSDAGGWIVSGNLAPNGICPDCGLHWRRRHGWRRRRLQDYPAHGDGATVALQVCRWRCLASACPRRTFSDQIVSVARPFARRKTRVGEVVSHLGHATGGRPVVKLLMLSPDRNKELPEGLPHPANRLFIALSFGMHSPVPCLPHPPRGDRIDICQNLMFTQVTPPSAPG